MGNEKERLLMDSIAVVALLQKKDSGLDMAKNIYEAMELSSKIEIPSELLTLKEEEPAIPSIFSYATENKLVSSLQEDDTFGAGSSSLPLELFCFYDKDKESAKISYGIKIKHEDLPAPILLYCKDGIGSIPKAALHSMKLALEIASKYLSSFTEIKILIPSDYVFHSITDWAYRWEKNSWRKSNGSIKNLGLVQDCFGSYKEIKHKVAILSTEEEYTDRKTDIVLFSPLIESGFRYTKSTAIISEKNKKD